VSTPAGEPTFFRLSVDAPITQTVDDTRTIPDGQLFDMTDVRIENPFNDSGVATLIPQAPWSVAPSGGNFGPHVYRTGTYGNDVCASVTTPSIRLGISSTLSFWSKYEIEGGWDKGVVEISSDGGFSWEKRDLVDALKSQLA